MKILKEKNEIIRWNKMTRNKKNKYIISQIVLFSLIFLAISSHVPRIISYFLIVISLAGLFAVIVLLIQTIGKRLSIIDKKKRIIIFLILAQIIVAGMVALYYLS